MSGFDDLVAEAMPYLAREEGLSGAAGSSWEWSYVLFDSTGVEVDLTGVTGVCELRRSLGGAVALSPSVSFPQPGMVKVSATPSQTASLDPGRYLLEIELTNAASRKVKVVGGGDSYILVKPEVTA